MTASSGENIRLRCYVSNDSYPQTAFVFWRFNGSYIAIGIILQLRDVALSNLTGVYECVAYNGYGTPARKTFRVTLNEQYGQTSSPLMLSDSNIQTMLFPSATSNSLDIYERVSYVLAYVVILLF